MEEKKIEISKNKQILIGLMFLSPLIFFLGKMMYEEPMIFFGSVGFSVASVIGMALVGSALEGNKSTQVEVKDGRKD